MAIEHRWCILRDNELLRKLLSSKIDELRLTLEELSKRTGLQRYQISGYLSGNKRVTLSQWGVVKLANELGYEIKLDISVKIPQRNN